jgi:hypothetical protein
MKKLLYKLDKHRRKWMHEYITAPKLNKAFLQNKPQLEATQLRVLKDLNEAGIAFLSFNELILRNGTKPVVHSNKCKCINNHLCICLNSL